MSSSTRYHSSGAGGSGRGPRGGRAGGSSSRPREAARSSGSTSASATASGGDGSIHFEDSTGKEAGYFCYPCKKVWGKNDRSVLSVKIIWQFQLSLVLTRLLLFELFLVNYDKHRKNCPSTQKKKKKKKWACIFTYFSYSYARIHAGNRRTLAQRTLRHKSTDKATSIFTRRSGYYKMVAGQLCCS